MTTKNTGGPAPGDAHEALVEKVAREIFLSRNGADFGAWSRQSGAHRAPYLTDARAALSVVAEALREPTEEMVKAHVETEWPEGRDYPCAETAAWEWASMLSVSPLYPKKGGGNA